MKFIILLSCLIFLIIPQITDGINCYICHAGTDGCGPSFKKTGSGVVTTSDSSVTYCTKIVSSNNNNAVLRGFGTIGTCNEGSVTLTEYKTNAHQYCCNTDLCNEASMRKGQFIFAIIGASIALLLIK